MVTIMRRLLVVTVLGLTQVPVYSMQTQSVLTKDALVSFAKKAAVSPLVQNFAKPIASLALTAGITWGIQYFVGFTFNKLAPRLAAKEHNDMSPSEKITHFLLSASTIFFYSSLDNWIQIKHLGLKQPKNWSLQQYAATWTARLIGELLANYV